MDSRFCLKVPAQPENDTILGTGSYRAGFNAAAFRAKTDAGLGWLSGDPQIARTFYLDLPATERIAARARVIRDQAGVLTGAICLIGTVVALVMRRKVTCSGGPELALDYQRIPQAQRLTEQ